MAKLKNFFTLDISNNAVEAISCHSTFFGRLILKGINRVVLDKGVIVNGVIKNPNALIKAIKKVLNTAKPKPITAKTCLLSIPENRMFTNIFSVPATLKEDEIEQYLLMQAEGIIPFSKDSMYSDYRVVENAVQEKKVLYVAAPRQLVEDILAILKSLSINVQVIELESLALARCLLPVFGNNKSATMIVDIGGYFSNIAIYDREGMKETVSLPVAGSYFTEVFRKKGKLSLEEALDLKEKQGCRVKDEKIASGLNELLDKILQEISRSIKYYEQKNSRQVNKIVLTGGSAEMVGLLEYFTSKLKIQIQKGDPWLHLKSKKNIILNNVKKTDVNTFATVIGLLLRGMRSNYKFGINILPRQNKKPSFAKFKANCQEEWPKIIILLLIILTLISIFYFRDHINLVNKNKLKQFTSQQQKSFKMTVDYAEQAVTNFDQSIIRGKLVSDKFDYSYELSNVTINDFAVTPENNIYLINETTQDKKIVANSRISMDGINIFYLKNDQVIPASGRLLVAIDSSRNSATLLPGRYDFVALTTVQKKSIYAEKIESNGGLSIITKDSVKLKSIEDQKQMATLRAWSEYRKKSSNKFLPDRSLTTLVLAVKYLSSSEKVSLVISVEFSWPQPDEQDWLLFYQQQCGDSCLKNGVNMTNVMIKNISQDFEQKRSIWQIFY
ncbi:MAG: hypothetical protein COX77_00425 [Candidatus Komeilibacteria bacterium CG_4_10_14_0_2_um_filter_37_10]|uniref:SHS2 domain-containing protein n=1 Tax=Candidatus Komeilibacteria bacterium CG_4_10_14_0_2_um_filter_37_10 TaxID=1974470 RepID=A0A2M7VGF3_9BACT|nr:MAG: hypothetical protein COX77_00425 [Candidatus Komeilibacteria bacterium CG_4_10_14_0_2_um_filter_37_10]